MLTPLIASAVTQECTNSLVFVYFFPLSVHKCAEAPGSARHGGRGVGVRTRRAKGERVSVGETLRHLGQREDEKMWDCLAHII